ncbi:basic salivary proline-rich protein 1-like [Ornithorhynchus anatinus]|uniref:basic salivary proline-rich protein 1-like n=1 Tax=Ornithorhynchus anatinus TaxID=9258 RepID=UPI0019D48121|nr:basic salivary proline-rich protein 1-like [Ornithorhynchus anatinus]
MKCSVLFFFPHCLSGPSESTGAASRGPCVPPPAPQPPPSPPRLQQGPAQPPGEPFPLSTGTRGTRQEMDGCRGWPAGSLFGNGAAAGVTAESWTESAIPGPPVPARGPAAKPLFPLARPKDGRAGPLAGGRAEDPWTMRGEA